MKTEQISPSIILDLQDREKLKVLQAYIDNERKLADEQGLTDTPLRPFLFEEERLGAMICCCGKCKKPSVYISYIVGFNGRIAYCEEHGYRKLLADNIDKGVR